MARCALAQLDVGPRVAATPLPAARPARAGGGSSSCVLAQDRRLEPPERRARLDPELLREHAPRLAVGLERVCLTAGAVEGDHEQAAQPLVERMGGDERLQFADDVRVATQGEVGFQACLLAAGAEILEPGDRLLGEGFIEEIGERRPAPEVERVAQRLGGRGRISGPRATPCPARAGARTGRRPGRRTPRGARSRESGSRAVAPPAGPSARRSLEICVWTAAVPLRGGSLQSSSIRRSLGTTSFALRRSKARSARCRRPAIGSRRSPSTTSSGPRIRNSMPPPRAHASTGAPEGPCLRPVGPVPGRCWTRRARFERIEAARTGTRKGAAMCGGPTRRAERWEPPAEEPMSPPTWRPTRWWRRSSSAVRQVHRTSSSRARALAAETTLPLRS